MEQENPGVSCTAKTGWGEKSAFGSNCSPSGAGVMFSTRQMLTKSDFGTITFAGLETPNSSGAVGLLRPVHFTSLNGFSFRLWVQTLLKACSANYKGLRRGTCCCFMLFKNAVCCLSPCRCICIRPGKALIPKGSVGAAGLFYWQGLVLVVSVVSLCG